MSFTRPSRPFRMKWTFRWTLKTGEKLRVLPVHRDPFARNGRWTSKTGEKLRVLPVDRDPFARNGR